MIALIVEAALRSLALGAVVWLAMLALRPRNPHLQKTVWITVLLASLVMPFVLKARLAPSFDVPTYVVTLTESVGGAANAAPVSAWQWSIGAITAIYAFVAIALLARFAIGLIAIWRIRRAAAPLANGDLLDIRVSPKVASPATFGSTILLPATSADWDESTLQAIISHERSHVRYWDCYVQWLARLHACVFWFNPLAWWLNRRLADLAETTSDDAVVQAISDRTAYADLLLEIARHPAPSMVTAAARSNISARIERIISNIPPALPPRRWIRGAAVLALVPLFVLAAATAQSPAANPLGAPAQPGATAQFPSPPAEAGQAGSNEDPLQPKIIDAANASDESNYPTKAKRHGVEGFVMVNATIDAEGRVTYVQITDLSPADMSWGFADAATQVAKKMKFSNPRHQPTQVKFKVKFDLKDKHLRGHGSADAPAPPGG
jgi:TonB family protein